MYSEEDINSAVAAGALSAESAAAFRSHMSAVRDMPRGDEENFRLINSFNDIFVAIGVVIMLFAAGAIGQAIGTALMSVAEIDWATATEAQWRAYQDMAMTRDFMGVGIGGLLVAPVAWGLAEFFTRRRRMALPSILLLLGFVAACFGTVFGIGMSVTGWFDNERLGPVLFALAALVAAGGTFLHWRRFMVPITVATGAAAVAATIIGLIMAAIGTDAFEDPEEIVLSLIFVAGLAIFAFAMRWDISDRERTTRRSDVAFWLHLLAAPMIAHPIFALIGVTDGDSIGVAAAIGVLAVYVAFGFVALAIDRRALLVSALAYVLIALTYLFDEFGAVELGVALTALIIGSALLTLSAFWSPIRKQVVGILPQDLRNRLPLTEDAALAVAA